MAVYSSPGSHTFNCTSAGQYIVTCIGAGGGGGGGVGLGVGGGGGGGGAYARSILNLSVGTYTVVVGAGGAGGSFGSNVVGTDGGDSVFGSNLVVAKGGVAGRNNTAGAGGSAATSVGQAKTAGSSGSGASGGAGGRGGDAGSTEGGPGGQGGSNTSPTNAGEPGGPPGGGGGGGRNLNGGSGGAGAAGRVTIEPVPLDLNGGFVMEEPYDVPGTHLWTAPHDGEVIVECVGGGAGGRGGAFLLLAVQGGKGGGGGEYASSIVQVKAGQSYEVVVGAGGTGTNYAAAGTSGAGGDTSFGGGIVVAKGGQGATLGDVGPGGTGGTGTTKFAGGNGHVHSSQVGGNGGTAGAGGPWGGAGGQGGSNSTPTNQGLPGEWPGGGGGGGRGLAGGHGGAGAAGGVRISYYKSFGSAVIAGQRRPIVKVSLIRGGVKIPLAPYRIKDGVKISTGMLKADASVYLKPYPAWLPSDQEAKFDRDNGGFNFNSSNSGRIAAALANAATSRAHFVMFGDSVGEGWTFLNHQLPFNVSADWIRAYPLIARNELAGRLEVPVGGTGLARAHGPQSYYDTQRWSGVSGWGNNTHFIRSNNATAHFTSDVPGTDVAVVLIDDSGKTEISVDGGPPTVVTGTGTGLVRRVVLNSLSYAPHTVTIKAAGSGYTSLIGAEVFNTAGITMHNLSQGGTKIAGSGQDVWGDFSHATNRMIPLFRQSDCYGQNPDCVIISAGGNDIAQGYDPTTVANTILAIRNEFPNSDCVIMTPAQGSALFSTNDPVPYWSAIYAMCLANNLPLIDTQWLTGGFNVLASQGLVGDAYGHPNVAGHAYFGRLLARALV